tara:strand:- start:505 stop:1110 length:606 start_codon:yes stop_codon:yes gene_type:complete
MNKILIFITIIIILLLSINFIWGRSNSLLETPKYKLIKKFKSFEIREYETMIIARTLVSSDYSEAASMGFRRVANYIFGDNDKDMKIAMTAPVLLNSPVDAENEYEISFMMPSVYNKKTLPNPNSSNVEILDRNLGLIACVSFGGWATKSKVEKYHRRLNDWIKSERIQAVGKFYVAQYNSPWALPPFRHNEILVRIKNEK